MAHNTLKVHPQDNVIVALTDLQAGEVVEFNGRQIGIVTNIPAIHKFAEQELAPGQEIIMYGGLVGKAMEPIPAGAILTTGNVKHEVSDYTGKTKTIGWNAPDVSKWVDKTFMGFHRADGQVGTGNYWLVIPLVFCENRNVESIKQAFVETLGFGQQDQYNSQDLYKSYVQQMVGLYQAGKTDEIA